MTTTLTDQLQTDQLDRIDRAITATGAVVAAVAPDRWADPTPCAEWDVRDLLNHLVGGMRIFAAELTGTSAGAEHEADWVGDDAVAAYRVAAALDRAAWRAPGAMERQVRLVFGPMPAPAAAVIHLTEVLVHGVDLAVAVDRADLVDEEACADLLLVMHAMGGVDVFRVPGVFEPACEVSPDAPAHRRLLAYLGRPVNHPSPRSPSWT